MAELKGLAKELMKEILINKPTAFNEDNRRIQGFIEYLTLPHTFRVDPSGTVGIWSEFGRNEVSVRTQPI
jgi:hypothetical protein